MQDSIHSDLSLPGPIGLFLYRALPQRLPGLESHNHCCPFPGMENHEQGKVPRRRLFLTLSDRFGECAEAREVSRSSLEREVVMVGALYKIEGFRLFERIEDGLPQGRRNEIVPISVDDEGGKRKVG